MNSRKATACGKVILTGEHAAVYGAKAIALPLFNVCSSITLSFLNRSDNLSHEIVGLTDEQVPHLSYLIDDTFRLFHLTPRPIKIACSTDLPLAAGLGASASLCVALVRGFALLLEKNLTPDEVAAFANLLEKRFHGNPSGLDTAVIAFEQPILFQKNLAPCQLLLANHNRKSFWRFVLMDSKTRSSTIAMIEKAKPAFDQNLAGKISEFNRLTEMALQGLMDGSVSILQEAMSLSALLLKEIGVVTPLMEELASQAIACGVLAVKPTGAGGGGFLLGLLPQDQSAAEAAVSCLNATFGPDSLMFFSVP